MKGNLHGLREVCLSTRRAQRAGDRGRAIHVSRCCSHSRTPPPTHTHTHTHTHTQRMGKNPKALFQPSLILSTYLQVWAKASMATVTRKEGEKNSTPTDSIMEDDRNLVN